MRSKAAAVAADAEQAAIDTHSREIQLQKTMDAMRAKARNLRRIAQLEAAGGVHIWAAEAAAAHRGTRERTRSCGCALTRIAPRKRSYPGSQAEAGDGFESGYGSQSREDAEEP